MEIVGGRGPPGRILGRELTQSAGPVFPAGSRIPGIAPVAQALTTDGSAMVRLAAANALIRLNTQGPNQELASALTDSNEQVRLAALNGATHINVFSSVDKVVGNVTVPAADMAMLSAVPLPSMELLVKS